MGSRTNRVVYSFILATILIGLAAGLTLRVADVRPASTTAPTITPHSTALPALQGEPAIRRLKEDGLYESLQRAVEAARYEVRWEEQPNVSHLPPSFRASNPAQRLNAHFTSHGLLLAPQRTSRLATGTHRFSDQAEWQADMKLIGYGYGESLLPVGAAELVARENRIEYRRTGLPLNEWYINKPEGIEQGFTLESPPGVRPRGERLRLVLELSGDLRAELAEEGQFIALTQNDGNVALLYADLHAYDARGQALPSEMKVEDGRVMLEVEDGVAAYPLTIDPLFKQQSKFTASDGTALDYFGASIAISDDTVVIGAPGDQVDSNAAQGSVYVFVRKDAKTWNQQRLIAGDGEVDDRFGISVAISGARIVVGAWGDDEGSNNDQGSAYVFVRNGTTWSEEQKLTASDGARGDEFGVSVAIGGRPITNGELIVVGAVWANVGSSFDQGAAYVFARSGGSWVQLPQRLTANDGASFDLFGASVAISGENIVVGASQAFVNSNSSQGTAYVFRRNSFGTFGQRKLIASDGAIGDRFGASVAISGETVVVGAWHDDIGSNVDQGSAYVYSVTTPSEQKLTASDGAAGDRFGVSVAISGETVVVGAYRDDIASSTGSNTDQGSAYVFVRGETSWNEQEKLTAGDGAAEDRFGADVAISMNMVVVGAWSDDIGSNVDQGSAYMFSIWGQQQKLTASDGAHQDRFGESVAIDKDTVVVGAPYDDVGSNVDQGSVYLFVRSGSSWLQRKLTASDGLAGDLFGISVAVNGDTVVVGAQADDIHDQGSAYVFVRSGTTWTEQQRLTASDRAVGDYFGSSVAIHDDTVVVGARLDDGGANVNQGSAYVFIRNRTTWTWSEQQKLTASDGGAWDWFGSSVAISGGTVVVGAWSDDIGSNLDQGSAYVFVRNGTTWSEQQKLIDSQGAAWDFFGSSVAISGETVVVGAWGDDISSNLDQGSAYVFVRSGTAWNQQQKLTASNGSAFDCFGSSVGISGETVVVGASGDTIGPDASRGSAYVFTRSGTSWSLQQKPSAGDGAAGDEFGISVAINGNTVVVGARYDNVGVNLDAGSAHIFVR